MFGWSSYQLSASRLLGWRLSATLSCSVVTEAHDPGQRMSLHPVLGSGYSSIDQESCLGTILTSGFKPSSKKTG